MSAALADQPIEDFPPPPKSALEKLDCPTVLPAASASSDVEGVLVELPPGCPSPSAAEFDPSAMPTEVLPSASDLVPSEAAPTVPGEPTPTQGSTGQPTAPPTNPAPPTDGPPEIPGMS